MKKKFFLVLPLLVCFFAQSVALASVGVQDDNGTPKGAINVDFGNGLEVIDNGSRQTINAGSDIVLIDDSTDTPDSVTAARNGSTFVLKAASAVGGVGYTLTLPTAAAGLKYTFVTGDGKTLSIKSAGSDVIYYGGSVGQGATTRITSPACTGSTVTVIGTSGGWFVQSMNSGVTHGTITPWSRATS